MSGILMCQRIFCLCLPFLVAFLATANASYVAYSMGAAERLARNSQFRDPDLKQVGNITRIAGIVYEKNTNDVIIIGQSIPGERCITLDDVVVGFRTRLKYNKWPLVSIDKNNETESTKKQAVRFDGGIQNTQYGLDFLNADVVLKKCALGQLPTDIWGVKSYFDLYEENVKNELQDKNRVEVRFWFDIVGKCTHSARDGVFAIGEMKIGVLPQVVYAGGKSDLSGIRSDIGEAFANSMTSSYGDICVNYPELHRLKILFDLASISHFLTSLDQKPKLDYWLNTYQVENVTTPQQYDLVVRERKVPTKNGDLVMVLDGGVRMRATVMRLQEGDVSALKEIVVQSRPSENTLVWRIPLEGWQIPGYAQAQNPDQKESDATETAGCFISGKTFAVGEQPPTAARSLAPAMFAPKVPTFDISQSIPTQTYSPHVGGVMLQNTAIIKGAEGVDLAGGNFSLVVDGARAQIDPRTFRKFVTALWAVYYSDEDPGISIDPIAPTSKKHMVRYIGRVINSDLGRVMREADYVMKKWAVGTERPDIAGFKNPDDYSANIGLTLIGASSRFWFVPENMTFKRGGNMLLFDQGRMTVKTEYLMQNKPTRAEPANEAFAKFFTDRYDEISAKYPVYRELYDYSKLVALARYLRDSGVPLFWFLIANKDLVLTEDAPGTVDELAKGSDYWKNLFIKGGVEMKTQGRYVYDEAAVQAINTAMSQMPTVSTAKTVMTGGKETMRTSAQPFSFDFEKKSYSVLPQHSLTSGKDRRGIRYQTDIALRSSGMPGLELVRYFNPAQPNGGEFGNGWRLLVPYRVKKVDEEMRDFLNAQVRVRMSVENLLDGTQETLTFDTSRYTTAGWVPAPGSKTQTVGLFLLTDWSTRLADKIGNQFWFDPAGNCTDIILSDNHHVKIAYLGEGKVESFTGIPYQVSAEGRDTIIYNSNFIPKFMRVTNFASGYSETLIFSKDERYVGYVPLKPKPSRFEILALMTNGSFRLADKDENEIAFDSAGNFASFIASGKEAVPCSLSMENQRIAFTHTLDGQGKLRIASARLLESGKKKENEPRRPYYVVKYEYDTEGRLCSAKGSEVRLGGAFDMDTILRFALNGR